MMNDKRRLIPRINMPNSEQSMNTVFGTANSITVTASLPMPCGWRESALSPVI
jgi:hypothetical protein